LCFTEEKRMEGRFRFLGTGGSMGVPVIGCKCAVCKSVNPKNKRTRSASLIHILGRSFVLDAGPDYRTQALTNNIDCIDGFILTHAHYDHMAGLDDMKVYASSLGSIPCLALNATFQEVKKRYCYLFKPTEENPHFSPFFDWKTLEKPFGKTVFEGLSLQYVTFFQAGIQVMGLKIGDLAYISDIKEYDPELISQLKGIKTLIISALRETSSPSHFSVQEACDFASLIQPQRTFLTHLAHEMDYEKAQNILPSSVFLAYDGLEISFVVEEL
jgi:phosphoribosyl 1,2-cyclic phosphate phosphodiesterase